LSDETRHRRFWSRTRVSAVSAAAVVAAAAGAFGASAASASPASPTAPAGHCSPSVSKPENFGRAFDSYVKKNLPVYRYTLSDCAGMTVKILTYGGIVQSIDVPGRNGKEADVVLGFKTLKDYVTFDSPPPPAAGGPYFGETVGRYANRIAKGTFRLNGQTYTLPINNGVNSLHGGFVGFGNHVWASTAVHSPGMAGVELTLVSPNGDGGANVGCKCTGYPAKITVHVTFTLNNDGQLGIHYGAVNDSNTLNTVINLTNHSYFNLAGEASPAGSAYSQKVQINSDNYSPSDATQIPLPLANGVPVAGTPFDFRAPHTIGSRIGDVSAPQNLPAQYKQFNQLLIAQGYDHNWILNKQTSATTGPDGLNLAAHAWDQASGRELTVWTDQPGVQFYSANFLTGTLVGISGGTYRQGAGYTFETQHFPDSPNQPNFPSTELKAGQTFNSTTIFQFSS
jgi:aldose 1-epimerase